MFPVKADEYPPFDPGNTPNKVRPENFGAIYHPWPNSSKFSQLPEAANENL